MIQDNQKNRDSAQSLYVGTELAIPRSGTGFVLNRPDSIFGRLMAAISAISMFGWGWVSGLSNPGSVVSWLDPATAIGLTMAHIGRALGYAGHGVTFVHSVRLVALGLAAAISVFLLVRSERIGDIRAIGLNLLAFAVLGPVVWPWYETWGFVFLAVMAERWTLRLLLVLSAVACFADVPNPGLLVGANPILVAVCWACFVGLIGLFVFTRIVPVTSVPVSQRVRTLGELDGR